MIDAFPCSAFWMLYICLKYLDKLKNSCFFKQLVLITPFFNYNSFILKYVKLFYPVSTNEWWKDKKLDQFMQMIKLKLLLYPQITLFPKNTIFH